MSPARPGEPRDGGDAPLPPELEALIARVLAAADLDPAARADVEADLRAHFEDGLAAGVPWPTLRDRFGDPAEAGRKVARARRAAGRRGGAGDSRWWASAGEWWTETRRAARRLARTPGFAAVVVLTLALGVGANTATFSVLDAVLLQPLPYAHPGRLVRVYEAAEHQPDNTNYLRGRTVAEYRTWSDVFDGFGALYVYQETGADLTDGERTVRVTTVPVTAGYFETLGVAPERGRTFREDESVAPGEGGDKDHPLARTVVLSHHLWADHFGGDPGVVGRTIRLDDRPWQVVGVMPEGFRDPFGPTADLWTPQDLRPGGSNSWGNYYLSAVARLKPGLTVEAAQKRVDALYARLVEAHPEAKGRWVPTLVPLHDDLVGPTRRTMLLLLAGAAALVLLTACVNLANLLFARGLGRDRDVAVRTALGSGRGRIVAGLLVEAGLLALAGGAAGLALGWTGVHALLSLAPDALPPVADPTPDARVFAFALAATLAALVLSGLAPALRLSRVAPADALRSDSRATTGGRRARRVRDGLAVAQVAAALMLVTGAGLLVRSLAALGDVPLNVDPAGVLTFELNLPGSRYPDGAAREALHRTLHERLLALPEVEADGAISWLPLRGRFHIWGVYWQPDMSYASEDGWRDEDWTSSDVRVISGDWFRAVGTPVVRGPRPADVDMAGEPVVWVSRRAVETLFHGADPVGKRMYAANGIRRVVGVVEDAPYDAQGDVAPVIYVPHAQFADDRDWTLTETVKVRGDMAAARERVRGVLASLDPQLVLYHPMPFADVVASARAENRFATALMAAFALLALVLATVGTYGVLAGAVAGRRREFGIRMALGADRGSVRSMVLGYAARLVLPGVALGIGGAWLSARWVQALLFQVAPRDPWVYGAAVAVFALVGLAAGWGPARRATRVDPARTLAAE